MGTFASLASRSFMSKAPLSAAKLDPDFDLANAQHWLRNLHILKSKIATILEGDCQLPGVEKPLTFSQIKLLKNVQRGCALDGCWSLQRLAEHMQISLPALSKTLSRLVPLALVEVCADPRDGRKRRAILTHAGAEAIEQFDLWRQQRLAELVGMGTPGEIQTWTAHLEAMVARLDAFWTQPGNTD